MQDGVNYRNVEPFEAFGVAEKMTAEACWVNQASFWHVIVNQARLEDFLLEYARAT